MQKYFSIKKFLNFLYKAVKLSLIPIGLLLVFVISIYLGVWGKLPNTTSLLELSQSSASEVYDVNGKLLGKYYLANRQPIPLDSMPQHLVNALLATEDIRFYEHNGIDNRSMARVLFRTLLLQDASGGGGSTITQQLAKNLFDRKNYSFMTLPVVKFKEMITARRLERLYTKDEILELYLNTVPFSGNTYGIESASLKFFNKDADSLTVSEAATLVGTLKATYTYNPKINPKESKLRRNTVLSQMKKYGFLGDSEFEEYTKDSIVLQYGKYDELTGLAPYFREEVRNRVAQWCEKNGYNLYTSGLKIYTTLDKDLQLLAEEASKEHMQKLQKDFEAEYGNNAPWLTDKKLLQSYVEKTPLYKRLKAEKLSEEQIEDSLSVKHKLFIDGENGKEEVNYSTLDSIQHYLKMLNLGMLSISPNSGAIKTWVGGVDYQHFKYDHISKSKRQVGSTFKPIVYTAALEHGIEPCEYFSAREVAYSNMEGWSPSNSGNIDEEYMNYSLQAALTNSINTVSVKVLEKTGINNTIALARKMGIASELPEVPSLALGTAELTIKEMAGAYAAYVNNSAPVKPYYLLRIEDAEGNILEDFKTEELEKENKENNLEPAFSETNRQLMLQMMQSVVNEGTGQRMRSVYGIKNDIAGKTGTTQSNKDAWFVGVTPKMVIVTWVGHDDHRIGFKTTRTGQGANAALPITALFLQKMNKEPQFDTITKAKFKYPSSSVMAMLNCAPTKRDGFFKRLFTNPNKKKQKNFGN